MRVVLKILVAWALVLPLALTPLAGQDAATPNKLSCEPDTFMENEDVRVWFQGLKGHIKVFAEDRDNATGGVYSYKTQRIAEVVDGEIVAEMDLSHAFPQQSTCVVTSNERATTIAFAVVNDVRSTNGGIVGDATVTFLYRLDHRSSEAKFDLFVNDWPWARDDSELAFDFQVHSTYTMETAQNGIGFRNGDGTPAGYMEWAPTADVVYEDEREAKSRVASELAKSPNTVDVRLRYAEVDPGYLDLDYDPWLGTGGYDIIDGHLVPDDIADRVAQDLYWTAHDAADDALTKPYRFEA